MVNFKATANAIKLRRCNAQNLEVAPLCDLDLKSLPDPTIWGEDVLAQYAKEGREVPGYIRERIHSDLRVSNTDPEDVYHAYDRDIGVVTFYFETAEITEYKRQARMTWVEFIAQVGGLLGLCLGLSLVSFLEIVYWFSYKLYQNF